MKTRGKCKCEIEITKEITKDSTRYYYTGGNDKYTSDGKCISNGVLFKYNIFRCENCLRVISDNWSKL